MAALPDVLHLLPIAFWWVFGDGTISVLSAYAVAVPGQEPALPPMVQLWSHHLHCVMHSAIVAGAVTLLLYAVQRTLWIPLLGWWSHIVIDVFTHSADYYAAPVLYPITERGFDGIAWNTPWFMGLNYPALAASRYCGSVYGEGPLMTTDDYPLHHRSEVVSLQMPTACLRSSTTIADWPATWRSRR